MQQTSVTLVGNCQIQSSIFQLSVEIHLYVYPICQQVLEFKERLSTHPAFSSLAQTAGSMMGVVTLHISFATSPSLCQ